MEKYLRNITKSLYLQNSKKAFIRWTLIRSELFKNLIQWEENKETNKGRYHKVLRWWYKERKIADNTEKNTGWVYPLA